MTSLTILHIEDNPDIADLVQTSMEYEGHKVIWTFRRDEIDQHIKSDKIDAVLLDYVLPDFNGMDVLKDIRQHSNVPVLMLSGKKKDPVDKIMCIENGADDYIEKPFTPREVLARIQAILKRTNVTADKAASKTQIYHFDTWRLDKGRYQAYDENDRAADLTTKEFLLLEKMVAAPHRTFERETLLGFLHEDNMEVYDRAVDIHMTRIRKKLRDDPQNSKYIKTVRGIGYMFCCDVTEK